MIFLWIASFALLGAHTVPQDIIIPPPTTLIATSLILIVFPTITAATLGSTVRSRHAGIWIMISGLSILTILGIWKGLDEINAWLQVFDIDLDFLPQDTFSHVIGFSFVMQYLGFHISLRRDHREERRELRKLDSKTGFLRLDAFGETARIMLERCRRLGKPASIAVVSLAPRTAAGSREVANAMNELAAVITGNMRQHDLCARLSETEYVMLLPFSDLDGTAAASKRLVRSVDVSRMSREISDEILHVRISIAIVDPNVQDITHPIRIASEALLSRSSENPLIYASGESEMPMSLHAQT